VVRVWVAITCAMSSMWRRECLCRCRPCLCPCLSLGLSLFLSCVCPGLCRWRTFDMSLMWRRDCKSLSRFHAFACGHVPRSAHVDVRVEKLCARIAALLDVCLSRASVRPAMPAFAPRTHSYLPRAPRVHTGPAKR
jgi:hypothetical protein